ncbi:MAG: D-alanine--D-alanine ligase [Myxococcales bacterium]|nr:D-alanine--D-alanine ligase [Myxococcales bacterium]
MSRRRVGVLMGGWSGEREVSMRTGEGVAAALEARGHEVVGLVCGDARPPLEDLVRLAEVDVVFLALHGRGGEDGCIQGALELLGVPYTGSGVLASALSMDKLKAKEMFRLHNVPTPPYYVAALGDLDDLEQRHGSFGYPAIVKPRREGSSLGVAKVTDLGGLAEAIERALSFDPCVLVERHVRAAEVHVGILDGRVLGAIEVAAPSGLFDYRAKYTPGVTQTFCPPRVEATRLRGVMNLAGCAARALDCAGACRVDVLVTEGQNEYVLEVNTLPGLTPTSLLPQIAAAAGLDYGALCEAILEGATLHAGLPSARGRAEASVGRLPARRCGAQALHSGVAPARAAG